MKILYLVGGFPKLSETFILSQITGLIDRGHEVEIAAYSRPREALVHPDVVKYGLLEKTRYIQYGGEDFQFKGDNVRALNGCLDADLIHAHFAIGPADVAFGLNKMIGIPYIVTAHAHDIFWRQDVGRLRTKFHAATKVLTVSEFNRRYLLDLLGSDLQDKILVHYLGVDLVRFPYRERKPHKAMTVLFIGRFVEKKGVLDALEAFSRVIERHPETRLRMIGDGPLKEEVVRRIEELGLRNKVVLVGELAREGVIEEFKSADLFFLPSMTAPSGDREGLPVALLEAQAMGLPVVSTRHTGIPEAVAEGESGFIVEERDVRGMADRIRRLIENPALRLQMGKNGRLGVEARHDRLKELDRLETVMDDVVKTSRENSGSVKRILGRLRKKMDFYQAQRKGYGMSGLLSAFRYELTCRRLDRFAKKNEYFNVECLACGYLGPSFYPLYTSGYVRKKAKCPRCDSLERHRLLLDYLRRKTLIYDKRLTLLEIAPMKSLTHHFSVRPNIRYFSTDLVSPDAMVRTDLRASAFRDQTFDVVVCMHVLEHIREDLVAMTQLHRILKKDGLGLVQVPVDKTLPETLEYDEPNPRESGHVRRYGKDFPERLKKAGFHVRVYPLKEEPMDFREKYGLISDEKIYCVTKQAGSALLLD